jgi:hypothetical protein
MPKVAPFAGGAQPGYFHPKATGSFRFAKVSKALMALKG